MTVGTMWRARNEAAIVRAEGTSIAGPCRPSCGGNGDLG